MSGSAALPLLVVGVLVASMAFFVSKTGTVQSPTVSEAALGTQTVRIYPTIDSYVSQASASRNFGTETRLKTGGSENFTTYMKFDVSSLRGKKVTKATLKLKSLSSTTSSQTLHLAFPTNWSETGINYSNRPRFIQEVGRFNGQTAGSVISVDFGKYIPAFQTVNVSSATVGVVGNRTDVFEFSSKEAPESDRPHFEFEYQVASTASPTSSPVVTMSPSHNPSMSPTSRPTAAPGENPTTPPSGGHSDASAGHAYGLWTPTKWDTCSKALHDSYYVIGPDGKKYPTWHPPVVTDPSTGKTCAFGHEHGRNPKDSPLWAKAQEHFAFDENRDGQISQSEKQLAGVPFGYINEQLDIYFDAKGIEAMRHEDHVGHKVEWAESLPVYLPGVSGGPQRDTGKRCNYLIKVHQGVSTRDAFQNNLHEVIYFAECTDGNEVHMARMGEFGKAGEFTSLCDTDGVRSTKTINTGFSYSNPLYPGNAQNGSRQIQDRACIEKNFLVPQGKFMGNAYEAWPTTMAMSTAAGKELIQDVNLLFDVENAARYYDPSQPNAVGYFADVCYEVEPNGDRAYGGTCSGIEKGIPWDSPKSRFIGTHRGTYFKPPILNNAGGVPYWYTDPFGRAGQQSPFPGSIRQYVATKNFNYAQEFKSTVDPTVVDRIHSNGGGTVHSPN